MAKTQAFIDPQVLAKIDGLALRVRRIVEGMFSGLHRSPFRGYSTDFAEHREYAPGDDLRYLDWKVWGRTDKHYIKQFDDETNMNWHLCLDASASMRYQGPDSPLSKLEYAQCLLATWAWLVLRQRDSAALLTFTDELAALVGGSSQPAHMERILAGLEDVSAAGQTDFGRVLIQVAKSIQRRAAVLVVSDFLAPIEDIDRGMNLLVKRKNEVIVIHVIDPAERDLPFRGFTTFRGLENRENEVSVASTLIRRDYRQTFEAFCDRLKNQMCRRGIRYLRLTTTDAIDEAILRLLRRGGDNS